MPSLIDRISTFIFGNREADPPTTVDETAEPSGGGNIHDVASQFKAEGSRIERVQYAREIYNGDARPKRIMREVAGDIAAGNFQIEVEDAQAAEIAEEARTRLKLDDKLADWCRLTFRDGDSLLELGVTAERLIAEITRKPTLKMHRNSNGQDKFNDPRMAYWMADYVGQMQPHAKTLWFADWQIVHARWDHDEDQRYGRPLMSSGQKHFKRFDKGELNVAVRRATRAGRRYHHVVEGDQPDIERYKKLNELALSRSDLAQADFFSNKPGGISTIAGDETIGSIDDIIHHIETWWIESPVPRGLLGYGRDLNRDVLKTQKEQYDENLRSLRKWAAEQIIKPILEMQWLLQGIVPDLLGYEIKWPDKAIVTPDDLVKIMQVAQQMRGLGFPEEIIQIVVARYLDGIEPEDLQSDMVSSNDVDRLARIANMLHQFQQKSPPEVQPNQPAPTPSENGDS